MVEPALAGRLHPDLATRLSQSHAGDLHDVIVELVPQVDPHAAAATARWQTRLHRRAAVVAALQDLANQTQGGVVALLIHQHATGHVKRIRPLWILNAVAVRATDPAIRVLAAHPDVWEVRRDRRILPPTPVPTDIVTTTTVSEWNIDKVRAPETWDLGHTGVGAVVGSFDTGVDITHPDLAERYRGNHAISWFDPYGENPTPVDLDRHGTHTTGTAVGGAASGTAIGVAPGAVWIAAKAWDNAGNSLTSAFHAIFEWFLQPGGDPANAPDVVNSSWAFEEPGCIDEFRADIQAFRAAGIFPAFAVGNTGSGAGGARSPANDADSFAVGATTSSDGIAGFSSRGPSPCDGLIKPDITAPGLGVRSSVLGGGYQSLSGTSMATPHVTGAVAVLRGIDQTLTVDEIETILTQTAVDRGAAGPDNTFGAGRLDLYTAAASHLGLIPPLPDLRVIAVSDPPLTAGIGATFAITDTTRNDGAAAPATKTAYFLSTDTEKDAGDRKLNKVRAIGTLAFGASSTGSVTVKIATATPGGTYFLLACADDANSAGEESEINNCLASSTTVTVAVPDLTETAVSNPPATAPLDASFEVTDTVLNQGNGDAGSFTIRYYLSTNKSKSASDPLLSGSRALASLAAQTSSTDTVSVTVPGSVSTGVAYYLLACADDLGEIVESSNGNNCRASTTRVTITP